MFEKEAEEYYKDVTVGTFQECKENFADAVLTAYKDGAEFGFQKGKNEWHDLQKDPNDLPEETEFIESDVLLLLIQLRGTKHKRYELGSYVFSENVFSYTHLKFIEDVIAWKEIIPPKQEE